MTSTTRCSSISRTASPAARARVLAAGLALLAASPLRAEPAGAGAEPAKARASALTKEASRAYQAGDYEGAVKKFEEAYALFASPRILFNLGQAYEQSGRFVEATESFERFLGSAGNAPADAQAEARRSLEEMRDKVSRIDVTSNVAGAEVFVDGRAQGLTPLPRAVLVAVGRHEVSVRRAGAEPFSRVVDAIGGAVARVEADLRLAAAPPAIAPPPVTAPPAVASAPPAALATRPAPAPAAGSSFTTRAGIGLAAAGPLLVAGGLYFGAKARGEADAISSACSDGCAGRDVVPRDRNRTRYGTLQWVLVGTGGAALLGGAALYLFGAPASAPSGEGLSVAVADGQARAVYGGRF